MLEEKAATTKVPRLRTKQAYRIDATELMSLAEDYLNAACGAVLKTEYLHHLKTLSRALDDMLADVRRRVCSSESMDSEDFMVLQYALDQYLESVQMTAVLKLAEIFGARKGTSAPLPLPSVEQGKTTEERGEKATVLRGYLCPEEGPEPQGLSMGLLLLDDRDRGRRKVRLKALHRGMGEWMIRQPVGFAVEVAGRFVTTGRRTDFLVEKISPWTWTTAERVQTSKPVCISDPLLMTSLLTGYDHGKAVEWAGYLGQGLTRLTAASCKGLEEALSRMSLEQGEKEKVMEQGRAAVLAEMKKVVQTQLRHRDTSIPLVRMD